MVDIAIFISIYVIVGKILYETNQKLGLPLGLFSALTAKAHWPHRKYLDILKEERQFWKKTYFDKTLFPFFWLVVLLVYIIVLLYVAFCYKFKLKWPIPWEIIFPHD